MIANGVTNGTKSTSMGTMVGDYCLICPPSMVEGSGKGCPSGLSLLAFATYDAILCEAMAWKKAFVGDLGVPMGPPMTKLFAKVGV